tara:strand:+ start:223 stop:570 length:348 start_codon:yes stop_codon:yes gene_type:complete
MSIHKKLYKDPCEFLKGDEKVSLIASLAFSGDAPFFYYDKLNLFAQPFISEGNRLEFPLNQKADFPDRDGVFTFGVKEYVLWSDTSCWPQDGTWFFWSHWALSGAREDFKVHVYV